MTIEDIKKYHDCGNLEFHSFIAGRDDLEEEEVTKTYELSVATNTNCCPW
jgi:hypothetical protein